MATRSITTSRPAVACDVCGRNLLRGEQPNVFLAHGERQTVCELCVERAAHEGWLREGDADPVTVRPPRGRRGRTLMGRLRQLREPRGALQDGDAEPVEESHPLPAAFADGPEPDWEAAVRTEAAPATLPPEPRPVQRSPRPVHAVPTNAELKAARALEVFNAGEAPRRVAGVARSLGEPWVTARSVSPGGTLVSVVVAWELCWYRYEIDLGDESSGTRLTGQGLELDELSAEDRAPNAAADEQGQLRMLAGDA